MPEKITQETFIKRSKEKYPGLFTYEKVIYKDIDTPVIITSIQYGDFLISPKYHLKKGVKYGGCKYLSKVINRNLSSDERLKLLIKKSKETFPGKFTYEKIDKDNFKSRNSKIILTCNKHGDFRTTFNDHFKNKENGGCPLCSKMIGGKKSIEEKAKIFIKKSNIKFNNNFDFSKAKITGLTDTHEFLIKCKKHNYSFLISAPDHIRSRVGGCPLCSKEILEQERLERRKKLYNKYIAHAKEIFDNKYDYSKIDFKIPVNDKNIIICPIHGEFYQTIIKHNSGSGCQKCVEAEKESLAAQMIKGMIIDGEQVQSEFIIPNDKYLKNKPYDAYVKKFDLIIEVDGDQHKEKKFNMTDDDLKKRKEIDFNKTKLASQYNYNFLRIKKVKPIRITENIINDLTNSTTIENLEEKFKKYSFKEVEYIKKMETEDIKSNITFNEDIV